jgi:antitoxin ParD1/3/4
MARNATINVSLTPKQLQLVRQRVNSGNYESASEVVREGLRILFSSSPVHKHPSRQMSRKLEQGYRATSKADRKLAKIWAILNEAWPEK